MAPVKVHVVYCGGWGYAPKYHKIQMELEDYFGADVAVTGYGTPSTTGFLEVEVNGKLVHSKKNGDGYVHGGGIKGKMEKIIKAVQDALT